MEKSEKYLGGFSSPYLRRGAFAGYGIYVTDKRIFGVYDRFVSTFLLLPRTPRKFYGRDLQLVLAKKGDAGMIHELERDHNFEARKEDITGIELKRPSWRRGHILIRLTSGREIMIWITSDQEFELARDLFQRFSPSTLSVV